MARSPAHVQVRTTGSGIGLLGSLMMMQWAPNTIYYWRVDPWYPGTGGSFTADEWSFTTET